MKTDLLQAVRKIRYRLLSNMQIVSGRPKIRQPVLFCGRGKIIFEGKVSLGCFPSPLFFSGYSHWEARTPEAVIRVGEGTHFNNSCTLIAEGPGITIGQRCLIGPEVQIFDSDFHGLTDRSAPKRMAVTIGDNVFIGGRAIILKGAVICSDSTIGAGAVVTGEIPPGSVVAGNPAQVVRRRQ